MSEKIKSYGIEIIINDLDFDSLVTPLTSIGLYNRTDTNSASVATDDTTISLNDVSTFNENDIIKLDFGNNVYRNVITAVNATDDEITLLNSSPENASIGNLTVQANSVLRWIQSSITGLTGWKEGIIIEKGIGDFNKKIDLKKGGSVEDTGKSSVSVINTNTFFNGLLVSGIYLLGKTCNIYKFENTTKTKQWSGYCENPSWNSTTYKIPLTGRYNKRKSFLGKYINSKEYENATGSILGNMIPLTFGKFLPSFDSSGNTIYNHYCRFIRLENKITKMDLDLDSFSTVADDLSIKAETFGGGSQFPIVSEQLGAVYNYDLKPAFTLEMIKDGTTYTSGTEDVTDKFSNTYLKVVEGKGKNDVRKINEFIIDLDSGKFNIKVSDVYEDTLAGNATATYTDNSWAEIVTAHKKYICDFWPMKNFISIDDGSEIQTQPNLSIYNEDEENYNQIPKYGYEIDVQDSNLNKLEINLKFYGDGYDDLFSFLDLPVNYFYPCLEDDLTDWGISSSYVYKDKGIFGGSSITLLENSMTVFGSPSNVADRDYGSVIYTQFRVDDWDIYSLVNYWEAYKIKNFPSLPENFSFDSVYLGIDLQSAIYRHPSNFANEYENDFLKLKWKRWIGNEDEFHSDEIYNDSTVYTSSGGQPFPDEWSYIQNILKAHYITACDDVNYNEKFFFENVTTTDITGYKTFELTGINNDNYDSMNEMVLLLRRVVDRDYFPVDLYNDLICREVCLLFKKSYNIKDKLYSTNEGRIYNDTWSNRFTATDLMESPLSILEHTLRLQNWSECDINPTEETWGHTYSNNPLILTGTDTEGSFDYQSSRLNEIRDLKCSRQILNSGEAYSDKIKLSLCKNFHLASFTDKNGFERIDRIIESDTDPTTEITFGDIINRKSISVEEPSPMSIYPEPFVKFQYDSETDSYQGIISITNTGANDLSDNEKESFVVGLSGSEAVEYWDRCSTLWKRTNQRNDPPSDLTDLKWANGEDGEEIAKIYLTRWIDWMNNPSVKFEVPEEKVSSWELVKRFKLTLPFHTLNISKECIVSSISVNPNTGITKIEAVILRDIGDSQPYSIIDVINSLPESSDNWDDHIEEQTDSTDNIIDNV